MQRDVQEGRQRLNFSEWGENGKPRELDEVWEVVQHGSMPPTQYLMLHSGAKLDPTQIDQLVTGLRRTILN